MSDYVDITDVILPEEQWGLMMREAEEAVTVLRSGTGPGSDFLGWLDLPKTMSSLMDRVEETADFVSRSGRVLVCVGIGGSYLGARAVIQALRGNHADMDIWMGNRPGTAVLFAGHHLDGSDLQGVLGLLDHNDYCVNVISKSGTTTEPAIAFRIIKEHMRRKYGTDTSRRIIATTDSSKGALRRMAEIEGYRTFAIPDDVGGRFSVLSPVGLIPICCAGISIRELLQGASDMAEMLRERRERNNPACLYAALRNALYRDGKAMEVLVAYQSNMSYLLEWWKQLFGESEGKEQKSLWPASALFTTDLHSLGQWMQDGPRIFFETLLQWNEKEDLSVPEDSENHDGLNYLSGTSLAYINSQAREATVDAHRDAGVSILRIRPGDINPYSIGGLIYFFEYSCALSGYMLRVNPFDQPGVEAYKRNMFRRLGKP